MNAADGFYLIRETEKNVSLLRSNLVRLMERCGSNPTREDSAHINSINDAINDMEMAIFRIKNLLRRS